MVEPSDDPRLNELRKRIEELNNKGTRVLVFLSFGIAAAVLLWTSDLLSDLQQDLLLGAMRWWVLAILPTTAAILPLKEIRENNRSWYSFVRWSKFALLWLAMVCIVMGTTYFIRSTLVAQPADNTQSTMLAAEWCHRDFPKALSFRGVGGSEIDLEHPLRTRISFACGPLAHLFFMPFWSAVSPDVVAQGIKATSDKVHTK